MQSGGAKMERWRIDFDILPGSSRWENPLMGYASSADYVQGVRMSFRSKEDAAHFAEKQGSSRSHVHSNQPLTLHAPLLGWDYYVYVGVRLLRDYPLTRPLRFQATRDGEAHSSQELRRELCVQAPQAPYHAHQVDYRDIPTT